MEGFLMGKHKFTLTALLGALALTLSGCLGTPIMTAEQQGLLDDVKGLKTRVAELEGGTGAGLEHVEISASEATAAVDEMRREFSFIRGTFDEYESEKAQLREDITASEETVRGFEERLKALEAAVKESSEGVQGLRGAVEANSRRLDSLETGGFGSVESGAGGGGGVASVPRAGAAAGDPEEVYFRGYRLTKDKEYDKAIETFEGFLENWPGHKLADHARYWIGEIYYTRADWERAILEFDRVINDYPRGDKVPSATLKQGMAFEKLGSIKEARVLLEQVVEKFPESPEAQTAKNRLKELK